MPMQQSISDIVADISRAKLPALIIDTCVSLDILRCLWRGNPRIIRIARQFIDARLNGELLLYSHSSIQLEASRNRVEVEGEAQKKATDIDQGMNQHRQAAQYLGVPYPHAAGYLHQSLVPSLVALHEDLLATCICIAPDDQYKLAAFDRERTRRRPARKGGGGNDCLMFEEFRGIAHALPAAEPLVLFTTNPEDFTDKSKGPTVIHQEISDDLAGTKGELCLNWDWAAKRVLSGLRLASI